MVFNIGGTDFSNHIIAGTYKVNDIGSFEEWVDASHRKHKRKLRRLVAGTFDMFFRTADEFNVFNNVVIASTDVNNAIPLTLTVNNGAASQLIEAFLTYEPIRDRDGNWEDYFKTFTVTLEER